MKSTAIKCFAMVCTIALAGCLQKPGEMSQLTESMSAPDGSCFGLTLTGMKTDGGLCSTKVVPEVKMYKYPLSTDNKMREAISAGALKCYWYVAIQGPGELSLTYWGTDGKQIVYDVSYNKDGYTLTFADSASMKYNEETGDIHAIYDLWFHGGETYGLYGLKPTLESFVRKAYEEENARGEALFGELKKPKKTNNQ